MIICRGLATSGLVCLAGVGGWGGGGILVSNNVLAKVMV